mmetsp:Transcript_6926/g.15036  ORF Transcript_6926/g.15036 Transcript_6926/m.15036 type:complete len:217 (-) Transcript_6926:726-1376(-)
MLSLPRVVAIIPRTPVVCRPTPVIGIAPAATGISSTWVVLIVLMTTIASAVIISMPIPIVSSAVIVTPASIPIISWIISLASPIVPFRPPPSLRGWTFRISTPRQIQLTQRNNLYITILGKSHLKLGPGQHLPIPIPQNHPLHDSIIPRHRIFIIPIQSLHPTSHLLKILHRRPIPQMALRPLLHPLRLQQLHLKLPFHRQRKSRQSRPVILQVVQ